MNQPKTLFERIGGADAVRATVTRLYGKILNDASLLPFFAEIDIERLRRSQSAFVSHAFGCLHPLGAVNLRQAHKRLVAQGLSDQHFDSVARHLHDVMVELGVPQKEIAEALAVVETTRAEVLDR
jgi:hemoglobin